MTKNPSQSLTKLQKFNNKNIKKYRNVFEFAPRRLLWSGGGVVGGSGDLVGGGGGVNGGVLALGEWGPLVEDEMGAVSAVRGSVVKMRVMVVVVAVGRRR